MKALVKVVLTALLVLAEVAVGLYITSLIANETNSHIGLLGVLYLVYSTVAKATGFGETPVVSDSVSND